MKKIQKFEVFLVGENFKILHEGHIQKMGFTVSKIIEAEDKSFAEQLAIELVRRDEALVKLTKNANLDPPVLRIKKAKILPFDSSTQAQPYSFYLD